MNTTKYMDRVEFGLLGFFMGQLLAFAFNDSFCGSSSLVDVPGAIIAVLLLVGLSIIPRFCSNFYRIGRFSRSMEPGIKPLRLFLIFGRIRLLLMVFLGACVGYVHQTRRIGSELNGERAYVVEAAHYFFSDQRRWMCIRSGTQLLYLSGFGATGVTGDISVRNMPGNSMLSAGSASLRNLAQSISTHSIETPLDRLAKRFRQRIETHIALMPVDIKSWYRAILLGDYSGLTQAQKVQFQRTGTIHLLIVSGLHVGMFAAGVSFFFLLPFWALYAIGALNPRIWVFCKSCMAMAGILAAAVYISAVGFPFATQRALVIFVVHQGSKVFFGVLPSGRRIVITLAAQIAIFPDRFLSNSMLLSWGAYLSVVIGMRSFEVDIEALKAKIQRNGCIANHCFAYLWSKTVGRAQISLALLTAFHARFYTAFLVVFRKKFELPCRIHLPRPLTIQLLLGLLTVAAFGSLSVIGFVANIVLVPVFGAIYGFALVQSLWVLPPSVGRAMTACQYFFLEAVSVFHNLTRIYEWLYQDRLPLTCRLLALALLFYIILNYFGKKSIRA